MAKGIWRKPAEESHEYPGLCLDDGRVTGSITVACSRLPLWAFVGTGIVHGWDEVEHSWTPTKRYDWTAAKTAAFIDELLEHRGEFGRLLLILADVERRDQARRYDRPWWERPRSRQRVERQLRRCLEVLESHR